MSVSTVKEAETDQGYPEAALKRAGVTRPYQVLLWAPRKFRDFTHITPPEHMFDRVGVKIVVQLRITSRAQKGKKDGQFVVWVADESGREHKLTLFGKLFFSPWNHLPVGATVHVEAKVTEYSGNFYLNVTELLSPDQVGRIVPVYAGKAGVIGADAVKRAITLTMQNPRDIEDAVVAIRQAFGGAEEADILAKVGTRGSLEMLLYQLHLPVSPELAEWAYSAARALAVMNIRHCAEQAGERPLRVQSSIRIEPDALEHALRALPFAPTRGARSQEAAIREIVRLLDAPYAMDAILTADVGVGKTLAYLVPAVLAQRRGARVAVLVPNTLLADSVAKEFAQCFPDCPVAVVTDANKQVATAWERNPVLIGTTRLFTVAAKQRWHPEFLVIDEQQKMSSAQRERLCTRDTNVLEASATPMPQTIALLRYGSKTQIVVDVQHAQKTLHSRIVGPEERGQVFAHMRELVARGEQVAIIYPKVQASGEADAKSVVAASQMWERHFPGQVVTLHGRMSDAEKLEALRLAREAQRHVVVASSIVEVGITIPRLRGMMVVNADRYGASTLHQMRGRLARHGGEGWFWLYLPDEVEPETRERMEILERTNNGFDLAELDMRQRGFGSLSEEFGVESESGTTRTLFRGIDLMPEDFEKPQTV